MLKNFWLGRPLGVAALLALGLLLVGTRPSTGQMTTAQIRADLKTKKEGWGYAHYTSGMGLGRAALECPSPLVVSTNVPKITVRYTAGKGGIAPGGMVTVWLMNNASAPQLEDPAGLGYLKAMVNGKSVPIRLQNTWQYRTEGDTQDKHRRRMADVLLPEGLDEGGEVVWEWNRVPIARLVRGGYEDRAYFRVYVDHDADGWEEEIPDTPWVTQVSAAANRIMVRSASMAVVGEPVRLTATAFDEWNNSAPSYRGTIEFSATGEAGSATLPKPHTFNQYDKGSHTFTATFAKPGFYWVTIKDAASGFVGESNPIEIFAEEPEYRLYWGDLHVHTEMSADARNGVSAPSTYYDSYRIGRYRFGLDFMANTDHHGYEGGSYNRTDWELMKQITNDANAPGQFVTLVATEISHGRGDQNIYFPAEDAPFFQYTANHPVDLWDQLRTLECFTVPHHFAQSMRPWDWNNYDPRLMPLAEIYSNHGRAEFHGNEPHFGYHPKPTIEGKTWQDQLARWRKLGAIAASDDHFAQPGYCGLAGVWAKSLTRGEIYKNLKTKHCYATTNARSIIHFTLNGEEMGSTVKIGGLNLRRTPTINVRAACPTEITEAVIIKNGKTVHEAKSAGRTVEFEWKDPDFTENAYYYLRLKQAGPLISEEYLKGLPEYTWTTPIWVEK